MPDARISRTALLVGLCPLIPIPFVDGMVSGALKRRLYQRIAADEGVALGAAELKTLTDEDISLVGCLWGIVVYPLKKLVKYALIFLIIKECLDWATELVHRAQMVRLAADRGDLPGRAQEVRNAMEGTFARYTHSPVTRVLWRQERPPIPRIEGLDPLSGVAWWLHRSGGGGLMVPDFERRLSGAPDPTEPPAPKDPSAPAEE
jgi:hypothetical protein